MKRRISDPAAPITTSVYYSLPGESEFIILIRRLNLLPHQFPPDIHYCGINARRLQ
ncbi:MAG TPA: hypothetical protein VFD58_32170 [Blastocatellia bacterium]|nr:hypothetical protein [Blastocatellia bacterium]